MQRLGHLIRELALWVGALLGLVAAMAGVAVVFFGCHFLVFRSGSMSPTIPTGSLSLAHTVGASHLHRGDIVTVTTASGQRVTHRIVSSTLHGDEASLVLKGDANSTPDSEVYDVRSAPRVVVSVPRAGYAASYLFSPLGLVVAACLSGMLVVSAFGAKDVRAEPPADPPAPRGHGKSAGRHAVAGAIGAAFVVSSVAGATGVTGTMATFTDKATMAVSVSTDTVDPPVSMSCAGSGLVNLTFSVPVNDQRYSYVLRLYTGSGIQVGGDFAMTISGATASKGFTPATAQAALGASYGTYTARVYSKLAAYPTWESPTFRSFTFNWNVVLGIMYLQCGSAGA